MFLRRLFLSFTLLSVGMVMSPLMTRSEALGQAAAETVEPAIESADRDSAPAVDSAAVNSAIVEPRVSVEDRFERLENGNSADYRFSGIENEIVVVYYETANNISPFDDVELLMNTSNSAGDELTPVFSRLYYPNDIDFSESEGRHVAFQLPETGEYSLNLDEVLTDSPETLLKIRSASYYERLMIGAVEKQDRSEYDDAARLFGLAIAQKPDQPTPYSLRISTYVGKVIENSPTQAALADVEDPADIIEIVHAGFLTLEADEQALVIDDFRQLARAFAIVVANGELEPDYFRADDLIGIADFLETGVSNEAVERVLFGEDR